MVDFILTIIWIALLTLYIIVSWKDAKSNNDVKREITEMNKLLLEQNAQLSEHNKALKTLIIRVCGKSVRERKGADENEKNTDTVQESV